MAERFMKLGQVMDRTGRNKQYILKCVECGSLPAIKPHPKARNLYRQSDVDRIFPEKD